MSAQHATAAAPPLGMALYHGFGANTFSWSFVQRRLAQRLGAVVTAHDQPGFGLTQRCADHSFAKHHVWRPQSLLLCLLSVPIAANREPEGLNACGWSTACRPQQLSAYTLQFNGTLGRTVLDKELAASRGDGTSGGAQRVLAGHSMGGACVAAEAAANPEVASQCADPLTLMQRRCGRVPAGSLALQDVVARNVQQLVDAQSALSGFEEYWLVGRRGWRRWCWWHPPSWPSPI